MVIYTNGLDKLLFWPEWWVKESNLTAVHQIVVEIWLTLTSLGEQDLQIRYRFGSTRYNNPSVSTREAKLNTFNKCYTLSNKQRTQNWQKLKYLYTWFKMSTACTDFINHILSHLEELSPGFVSGYIHPLQVFEQRWRFLLFFPHFWPRQHSHALRSLSATSSCQLWWCNKNLGVIQNNNLTRAVTISLLRDFDPLLIVSDLFFIKRKNAKHLLV